MKYKKKIKAGGRKHRKQKRKQKQMSWLTDGLKKRIRKAAAIIASQRFPAENYNKKVHCKECQSNYCLAFDGNDVFCKTCYCKSYCSKELRRFRTCQSCKGDTYEKE